MPDVIFTGAGPIGLLGAIQLQLECPEVKIIMFEKYRVPLRKHAMYVDHNSFAGMNKSKGLGEILDSISSKVIISDLETTLRAFAISLGIVIEFEEITDFKELKKRYPDTHYFVGSGGLRGIIHPQIFSNENQIEETLRYAVEVKYKAQGATRSLNKLTEAAPILAKTHHTVSEYVGHLKTGVEGFKEGFTPVSLRIFIDEPSYQVMKAATFKNPYTLANKEVMPQDLYETIQIYLRGRHHKAGECIIENSLTIASITLSLYASKYFCKTVGEDTFFQIGEEAFACPFYRSFNDNASCIPAFSKAMKASLANEVIPSIKLNPNSFMKSSSLSSEEKPLEYYQRKTQALVDSEIRTIYVLNFGIDCIDSSIASSRAVPKLSSMKLSTSAGGRSFLAELGGEVKEEKIEKNSPVSTCTLL